MGGAASVLKAKSASTFCASEPTDPCALPAGLPRQSKGSKHASSRSLRTAQPAQTACVPSRTAASLSEPGTGVSSSSATSPAYVHTPVVMGSIPVSTAPSVKSPTPFTAQSLIFPGRIDGTQLHGSYEHQPQHMHHRSLSPHSTGNHRCFDANQSLTCDEALAVALAHEEAERADRYRAVEQRAAGPSLLYPPLLPTSSRDDILSERLSRLPSVLVQPRTSFTQPPPTHSYCNQDRDRLLLRLDQYDLLEKEVLGDGACQFRSLSDQLYGDPEHHAAVRSICVSQLRAHPQRYSGYVLGVTGGYDRYCSEMAKTNTWGDNVTLQAISDHYGLRIMIITSFRDNCVLAIEPAGPRRSSRVLWLSFWAEVHYNSLYPREEGPVTARVG